MTGPECVRDRLRRLWRSDGGVAAIEFVIIAPMMLLILLGFSEIYLYMRAVSSVEHTAFVLADSLGQVPNLINSNTTTSDFNLGTFWNAAINIASPLDMADKGGVIITSICDSSSGCKSGMGSGVQTKGTPSLLWQASSPWNQSGMTTRESNGSLLPSSWPFYTGDAALVVEVFYNYNPFAMTSVFWANAPGTQTIYERIYVRPRSGNPTTLTNSSS